MPFSNRPTQQHSQRFYLVPIWFLDRSADRGLRWPRDRSRGAGVAALFEPLRHRIQAIIDQCFYRRKYDAAKTLEAFSTTLRQEVDLAQLREQLLTVVQETMQPAHVSLWLRKSGSESKSNIQV